METHNNIPYMPFKKKRLEIMPKVEEVSPILKKRRVDLPPLSETEFTLGP